MKVYVITKRDIDYDDYQNCLIVGVVDEEGLKDFKLKCLEKGKEIVEDRIVRLERYLNATKKDCDKEMQKLIKQGKKDSLEFKKCANYIEQQEIDFMIEKNIQYTEKEYINMYLNTYHLDYEKKELNEFGYYEY